MSLLSKNIVYDFNKNNDIDYTEVVLLTALDHLFEGDNKELICKALWLAKKYHRGQLRSDGSPYIIHPMRVLLLIMIYDPALISIQTCLIALLHDILEDTNIPQTKIEYLFGNNILEKVLSLTRYKHENMTSEEQSSSKREKWERMMTSPLDVRIVKVYDAIDNIISMKFINPSNDDYYKIPRWIDEATNMHLRLACITSKNAYILMHKELNFYNDISV